MQSLFLVITVLLRLSFYYSYIFSLCTHTEQKNSDANSIPEAERFEPVSDSLEAGQRAERRAH